MHLLFADIIGDVSFRVEQERAHINISIGYSTEAAALLLMRADQRAVVRTCSG